MTINEAAFGGASAAYLGNLLVQFQKDPSSFDPEWAAFFRSLGEDGQAIAAELTGASFKGKPTPEAPVDDGLPRKADPKPAKGAAPAKPNGAAPAAAPALAADPAQLRQAQIDSIRALMLIRAHRVRGHLKADLDPLGLTRPGDHPELNPANYGFGANDLDRPIFIDGVLGMERATMRQILERLQAIYCRSIGVEFMHIQDPAQKDWIQRRIEQGNETRFDANGKRKILADLTHAEGFEKFLQVKYVGTKRFGLEGGESLIPALEEIVRRGSELGLREVVIGMAHRGRLNVLSNIVGKPFSKIFAEFQGTPATPTEVQGSGDVKYHLGTSSDRDIGLEEPFHLSLAPNPSHLEAVNPVVLGRVRAKQQQRGDVTKRSQVAALLIHGDAAVAGQGVVPESLLLSELKGYRTGGTLHVVINNQIGFTTTPAYARSGVYCTDVAKTIQAPVFHVNGDDPEAVVHVARIAVEFRQEFGKDVFIDLVCYRRHGHNEGDEPAFTQPTMYKVIKDLPTTRERYAQRLASEGSIPAEEAQKLFNDFTQRLEEDFTAAKSYRPNKVDWLEGRWTGMTPAGPDYVRGQTGVALDRLRQVGAALARVPDGFDLNPKIARQLKAKQDAIDTGEGIDWATGEALAFGTLLAEGMPVRLSGQDVGRGTFSQRHAILYDQTNETRYLPLNHVGEGQATAEIIDSPLSEFAVMGFEYGYATAEPKTLVLWEGQFGDFANTAQVMIDQFIASGETKWFRMAGLVLLLPHGYEGQGPEHSSARLERYLQLCAEDNMQVLNCTTPANYFHALRRQIHRTFRKPLIVMTPKSLLRHKAAVSSLAEFAADQGFHRVLPDSGATAPAEQVRRIVVSAGKVYYDLAAEREQKQIGDVALVRLEQIYPFPATSLATEFAKYPNAEIVWCQEEPENQGAWTFVDRRIEQVLSELSHKAARPRYVGRKPSASPATGLLARHNEEQAHLVNEALAP